MTQTELIFTDFFCQLDNYPIGWLNFPSWISQFYTLKYRH